METKEQKQIRELTKEYRRLKHAWCDLEMKLEKLSNQINNPVPPRTSADRREVSPIEEEIMCATLNYSTGEKSSGDTRENQSIKELG